MHRDLSDSKLNVMDRLWKVVVAAVMPALKVTRPRFDQQLPGTDGIVCMMDGGMQSELYVATRHSPRPSSK